MQGDFSLDPLFAPPAVTRVLMQQGRVLLPSDWNEQVAVTTEQQRLLARDLIGPHGGPARELGFAISVVGGELHIGAGRYWVGGVPVAARNANGFLFTKQPFYDPEKDDEVNGNVLVYLEVREIHVSAAQDASIREIALGGIDTASRAVVIWQVRVLPWGADAPKATDAYGDLVKELIRIEPELSAQARKEEDDRSACVISPEASYRGPENQLYRVEIHQSARALGGKHEQPTFKWSRDNGSMVFPVKSVAGRTATLLSHGRDARTGLEAGDYVEVLDDATIFNETVHDLIRVKSVRRDTMTVQLEQDAPFSSNADRHAILRRWDGPARPVPMGGNAVPLEHGIEVNFTNATAEYRPGDYWLIPARTITGDVIWERKNDAAVLRGPHGPQRFYAPLAFWDGTSNPVDLRLKFAGLAK